MNKISSWRFRSVYVLLLTAGSPCRGDDITVRVISAKDGRPFAEQHVQFTVDRLLDPGDNSSPKVFSKWEYTDADGKAVFHVDLPPLDSYNRFWFGVYGLVSCSPVFDYPRDQVMRVGKAVSRCPHRPKGKFGVPPHPGEIVMYMGEYTRLEMMLYFPWPW